MKGWWANRMGYWKIQF